MGDPPKQQTPISLGDSVIPYSRKVRKACVRLSDSISKLELPQVAFVGSPSSGKSSVLEALVGRDFLPRGPTRRPLVLQLRQIKDGTDEEGEYGEFSHIPGRKFYDFNEIRMEIQAETDKEAGGGISDKEIQLKIFSPNFPNLTLIDFPGITKLPARDQPCDIEDSLTNMIISYIKKNSCLIIAVTPGNTDICNSDALEIAGKVDPDGLRTIGVLTKLDTVVNEIDAWPGKLTRLQNGYVGVEIRCREDNRAIKDALAAEEEFFRSHPAFNKFDVGLGVPMLAKRVNLHLLHYIKAVLLLAQSRLSDFIGPMAKELGSYGETAL